MNSSQLKRTQLLEENRRLSYLVGKYQRNVRNKSSQDLLDTINREIKVTENRISKLYTYIQSIR